MQQISRISPQFLSFCHLACPGGSEFNNRPGMCTEKIKTSGENLKITDYAYLFLVHILLYAATYWCAGYYLYKE